MKKILQKILILLLLIITINCAPKTKSKYEGYNDQQLYDKALQAMEKKKWEQARELLKYLIENYYDSKLIMPAKLALADSYFKQGGIENYIVATQLYEEYLKFYPSSIQADYAQYQIGLCYFHQINKPGRDQTNTMKTITSFNKLIENYPRSAYIQSAQEYIIKAYKNLNNHYLTIAKFYLKKKKWEPALNRLEEIIKTSPKESITAEIYYYYAETLEKAGRKEDSKMYYLLLQEKYPRSKYAIQSRKKISQGS
jgi:outer membrane protein assembly factor BamD